MEADGEGERVTPTSLTHAYTRQRHISVGLPSVPTPRSSYIDHTTPAVTATIGVIMKGGMSMLKLKSSGVNGGSMALLLGAAEGGRRSYATGRGANRASQHGHRSPVADSPPLNREEAEQEINEGKEEKRREREEIEKKLDEKTTIKGTPGGGA